MSRTIPILVLALATTAATPALASDGVIEINQAKALAGGVNGDLALDPPGFPVTITQSGSYRLTGLLTVPDANTDGIVVTALRTTIDLGGFEIRGPNRKPTAAADCTAPGIGRGVYSELSVHLRNGRISGMGSPGALLAGTETRVESIVAVENCGSGINVGPGSFVTDSVARLNSGFGIVANGAARIRDSIAEGNRLNGIAAGSGSVVTGCVTLGNRQSGIGADDGSVVEDSTANRNLNVGIAVGPGSIVARSAMTGNTVYGLVVSGGSTAVHNAIRANGSLAISSLQSDGIGGNTLSANGAPGIVAGVALHCNALDGVGSCPP